MSKFKFGLTLVLAAAITGCDKSEKIASADLPHAQQGHLRIADGGDNWQAAANPDNPFDRIGLEHNQCLSYILDQVPYQDLGDADQVYATGFRYGAEHYEADQVEAWRAGFSADQLAGIYAKISDGIPDKEYLLGLTRLEGSARDYVGGLLDQLYTPDAELLSLDAMKQIVVRWEAGIHAGGFDERDSSVLYALGSTLRYSMYAWTGAEFPDDGSGHVHMQRFHLRLFGTIATFFFDAVGSAVGPIGTAAMSAGCAAICGYNGW